MDEMTEHLLHAIEKLSRAVHAMMTVGPQMGPHTHQLVADAKYHVFAARKLAEKPADPLATIHPVSFAPPAGQVVVGKPAA